MVSPLTTSTQSKHIFIFIYPQVLDFSYNLLLFGIFTIILFSLLIKIST